MFDRKKKEGEHWGGTLLRPPGSFWWEMASLVKRDKSLNAPSLEGTSRRTLSNYRPLLPDGSRGTCGPVALHPSPNLLGVCGISINRLWNQAASPAAVPTHPPPLLLNSVKDGFFFSPLLAHITLPASFFVFPSQSTYDEPHYPTMYTGLFESGKSGWVRINSSVKLAKLDAGKQKLQ